MPYSFGVNSKVELVGVHPSLVEVAQLAIAISEQDFSVHDGLRTEVEQAKLVAKGASQTMNSMHLRQADGYGHAMDLVPYINGKLRWEWGPIYVIAEAVHQAAGQLGVKLVWGGVWDIPLASLPGTRKGLEKAVNDYVKRRLAKGRKAFIDGPHYQLA
ncbi:MAG TPA: M15 family metallopeptidase [Croceibacterium sp.]|nr:M15 family metallopeptidase [Croceibacterium sp.]